MGYKSIVLLDQLDYRKDLIQACIQGSRDAQRELYFSYSDAMYNVAFRMVNNAQDAEDILQNAFLEVFKNLGKFRYQSTPGAWIKRIVINKALNFINKEKKVELAESDDHLFTVSEGEDLPYDDYSVVSVKRAISQLPDGYRVVLTLYLIEGYDHKEISQILGINEATSKSQYSRAKKKLRDMIKREMTV